MFEVEATQRGRRGTAASIRGVALFISALANLSDFGRHAMPAFECPAILSDWS